MLAGEEQNLGGYLVWGVLGNLIDVFFVISGFLLFLPLVTRGGIPGGGWGRWLAARISRVFPAYWVCLTLALALVLIAPPSGIGSPSPVEAAVQYGGLQMPVRIFDPAMPVGFGVDGPLWMISVIVAFYLVLPLVARSYLRHPLAGLAVAAAVTIAWKEVAVKTDLLNSLSNGSEPAWVTALINVDQFPAWALSFALGMTGAWAYHGVGTRWPEESVARLAARALPLIVLAYAVFAFLYARVAADISAPISGSVARSDVLIGVGSSFTRAALLAAILVGPAALRRPLEGPRTSWFAGLGYGLYLVHFVFIVYAAELLGRSDFSDVGGFLLLSALVLPLSFAYAYASRRWIEDPARDWVRRRGGPAPRVPAADLVGRASMG